MIGMLFLFHSMWSFLAIRVAGLGHARRATAKARSPTPLVAVLDGLLYGRVWVPPGVRSPPWAPWNICSRAPAPASLTTLLASSRARSITVSAWNDNGLRGMARDPTMIYRSDFFPGLGWMLTRRVWGELSVKWPDAYWDDWVKCWEVPRDHCVLESAPSPTNIERS